MRPLSLLVLLIATPTFAQDIDHAAHHADDEEQVLSAADQFTEAIIAGDQAAMEGIFAENALILESGGIESRKEYFGHHFGADSEFLAAMAREPIDRIVSIHGDVAWVSSQTRMHG